MKNKRKLSGKSLRLKILALGFLLLTSSAQAGPYEEAMKEWSSFQSKQNSKSSDILDFLESLTKDNPGKKKTLITALSGLDRGIDYNPTPERLQRLLDILQKKDLFNKETLEGIDYEALLKDSHVNQQQKAGFEQLIDKAPGEDKHLSFYEKFKNIVERFPQYQIEAQQNTLNITKLDDSDQEQRDVEEELEAPEILLKNTKTGNEIKTLNFANKIDENLLTEIQNLFPNITTVKYSCSKYEGDSNESQIRAVLEFFGKGYYQKLILYPLGRFINSQPININLNNLTIENSGKSNNLENLDLDKLISSKSTLTSLTYKKSVLTEDETKLLSYFSGKKITINAYLTDKENARHSTELFKTQIKGIKK